MRIYLLGGQGKVCDSGVNVGKENCYPRVKMKSEKKKVHKQIFQQKVKSIMKFTYICHQISLSMRNNNKKKISFYIFIFPPTKKIFFLSH